MPDNRDLAREPCPDRIVEDLGENVWGSALIEMKEFNFSVFETKSCAAKMRAKVTIGCRSP